MARLVIENLTMEQAKTLADWYEGQGEQDADAWFECNSTDSTPQIDTTKQYIIKSGCIGQKV